MGEQRARIERAAALVRPDEGRINRSVPPQRFVVHANWKAGAENFISDFQHAQSIAHASALAAMGAGASTPSDGVQSNPAPGHGLFVFRALPTKACR